MEVNPEYKTLYNNRNNDEYIVKDEYKPETIEERIFNPKSETYEYKQKTINHKLEWENTENNIVKNLTESEELE